MRLYAQLLQWFGFGLCHQLPERSLFGGGIQAPVCARDTGIYVGVIASILLINTLQDRPSELPSKRVAILLAGFVLFMAVDGITSYAGLRATTNVVRLASGLAAGYAIGALAVPLLNDQLWRRSSSERILGDSESLVVWLASIPIAYVLSWWGGLVFSTIYPLMIACAVLATLTAVNLVIVTLLPSFERKADRLREAWLPLLLAFGLACVEIAASSAIKLWLNRVLG